MLKISVHRVVAEISCWRMVVDSVGRSEQVVSLMVHFHTDYPVFTML